MLYFDTTKTGRQGHRSGLTRVSRRLRDFLGEKAVSVSWQDWQRESLRPEDWFFTAELFSEPERPGFWRFLREKPCRTAVLFHDAIPVKRPDITWPQSVARHPEYMKMLASFDRVWAVSEASRRELLGFWRWQGLEGLPEVAVLPLGADIDSRERVTEKPVRAPEPVLLCVGILEPRKNQLLALEACRALWDEGLAFELHLVGRINPHFGKTILEQVNRLSRNYPGLRHHEGLDDEALSSLYRRARATLFPTLAEGCGLPLLESLWQGLPCLCSDLPVLRENADGGGCEALPLQDLEAWKKGIREILTDDARWGTLAMQARTRQLPTWKSCAEVLAKALI